MHKCWMLLGFVCTLAFASQASARGAPKISQLRGDISELAHQADMAERDGKTDVAAELMKRAASLSDALAAGDQISTLEHLNRLMEIYDDPSLPASTEKLLLIANRELGSANFHSLYAQAQRDRLDGNASDQSPQWLEKMQGDISALQKAAKAPDEIAKASLLAIAFSDTLSSHGQKSSARSMIENAISNLENIHGTVSLEVADAYAYAASLYNYWYESSLAVKFGQRSLEVYRQLDQPFAGHLSLAASETAGALTRMGRTSEAEPLFALAMRVVEHRSPRDAPSVARALDGFAQFYDETGHPDLAGPLFVRAAQEAEKSPASSNDLEGYLGHVSQFYFEQKLYVKAREINLREQSAAERHLKSPYIPRSYLRAALIALAEHRLDDAQVMAEKGRILRMEAAGPDATDNSFPLTLLARIASARGDNLGAANYWSRAIPFIAKRGYPNREHEETVIGASWSFVRAGIDPKWEMAREAGDALSTRVIQNAQLATGETRSMPYEPALYDKLLDVGWASK